MRLPVSVSALRGLLKELRGSENRKPLVIGGAHELARVLERELTRDGDAAAVRVGDPEGAAVYVHLIAGSGEDETALKRAHRGRVPIVAVQTSARSADVPYVLATSVGRVGAG